MITTGYVDPIGSGTQPDPWAVGDNLIVGHSGSGDTLYINKASPWENAYVESFNGKLRDELLNRELFLSLAEARCVVDEWRLDYNHHRPH